MLAVESELTRLQAEIDSLDGRLVRGAALRGCGGRAGRRRARNVGRIPRGGGWLHSACTAGRTPVAHAGLTRRGSPRQTSRTAHWYSDDQL